MKIIVNSSLWKKAVSQALSLVGKKSGNPNESCVGINLVPCINTSIVELWVLEAGVHTTKIVIPECTIIYESREPVYIQASSLEKLNKANIDSTELTILVEKNKLVYSVEKLGAISEPLYHNQNPFKGMDLGADDYILISEGNTSLVNILKSGLKFFVDKDINIILKRENSYITSGISLSADVKYVFNSNLEEEVEFSTRTDTLKKLSFLLEHTEEIPLLIEKGVKILKITSSKGETIINVGNINKARIKGISSLDCEQEVASSIFNAEDLKKIIKWQSYGVEDGDTIFFESEGNNFLIKGSKSDKPSILDYKEETTFQKINLPSDAIIAALNFFVKDSEIKFTQIKLSAGNFVVGYLILELEELSYKIKIYLGEPAKYK